MKPEAGVLLLLLFLGLDACTLDYGKDKTPPADQVPLMVFDHLRQTTVKNGKILYTVESEGSESFPSHKQVRLKRFRFQEYDSQGKAASEGEAESAVIDTATNDATVAGRLQARSAEQKVTLVIDGGPGGGLSWADGDRILKTLANTPVVLTKDDGSRIDAKSMVLDLGTNRLELQGAVHGTWTPEANQNANSLGTPVDAGSAPGR
jgi:LPS export ABC transporter protein LptC